MTEALAGVAGALAVLIPVLAAQYVRVRRAHREERVADSQLTEEQRAARVEERREDERNARDEYRDLYRAVKREVEACQRERQKEQRERWAVERRVARLEAALLAAGLPLPPMVEDGSDEHRALREREGQA